MANHIWNWFKFMNLPNPCPPNIQECQTVAYAGFLSSASPPSLQTPHHNGLLSKPNFPGAVLNATAAPGGASIAEAYTGVCATGVLSLLILYIHLEITIYRTINRAPHLIKRKRRPTWNSLLYPPLLNRRLSKDWTTSLTDFHQE